jgi:hypothetical protein
VKFNKGNPVHRSLISLYATIIEQTDSAVTLITKERWTGVNHLLRSAFEAHVDLINLANDEAYLDQMMAAYHREWIKFTGEGVKGENPYLIFFKDNPEALEQLAYHKAELERIRANGPTLNIFERFEKAGLANEYRSMYNSLCNDTHNNIRALQDRHFRVDEADGLIEVVIFEDVEPHSFAASLDAFIAIINGSSRIIHQYFDTDAQAEVEQFHTRRTEKGLIWRDSA